MKKHLQKRADETLLDLLNRIPKGLKWEPLNAGILVDVDLLKEKFAEPARELLRKLLK
jgi:hypothetical protein